MKKCERCGKVFSLDNFYSRMDRAGYFAWCKSCMKAEGRLKTTKHSRLQQDKGYVS